jgi:hypothetical protein
MLRGLPFVLVVLVVIIVVVIRSTTLDRTV